MAHTSKHKRRLLSRLRRMKGQVEALESAIEAGVECGAVLQQIAAVRGAANGLLADILEGQLTEHLSVRPIRAGRQRDREAVSAVIRRYLR